MENDIEIKGWRACAENKSTASLDDARFIYDQAEKKLKEIVSSGDLVVGRSTTIITFIVGLLVALIGFSINRYFSNKCFDKPIYTSIIVLLYLFIILFYISKNIKSTRYSVIGSSPKTLFSKSFFSTTFNEEARKKMFIWAQIENYQDSIDLNDVTNNKRWDRLDNSITMMLLIPILLIVSFFIMNLFL